jgi:hypothetical protein
MVGLAQPVCLSALGTDGRRYECNMNLRKRKARGVSFHYSGLDGKHLVFCRRGEAFVLTSSFIERDYRKLALSRIWKPTPKFVKLWVQVKPFAQNYGFSMDEQGTKATNGPQTNSEKFVDLIEICWFSRVCL